jgi:SAM-dependent methyltransferase
MQMPSYVESHYWDDAEPGEVRDGVTHQDLHRLTFDNESFDVVTSSHVLEHVAQPNVAFSELFRVLKPAGRLIFSIPIPWPPPEHSTTRALVVGDQLQYLLDPVYHESPGGNPSLVFTDFGTDIHKMLQDAGFAVRQTRPHIGIQLAFRDSVFVATKEKRGISRS